MVVDVAGAVVGMGERMGVERVRGVWEALQGERDTE